MHFLLLDQFLSNFSSDIGIDLGTANTPVLVRGRGVRLREPSYVAIDREKSRVIAVGNEAKMMYGKTPKHISVIRPVRDGVIANFEIAEEMMKHLLKRLNNQALLRPRVIVGVPSDVSAVERRAVNEAARQAGARVAYIIEQPLAAAIGAGLPVLEPRGNMVVDIGGGTSEAAVISLGGVVISKSIRIAGDEMDEVIVSHIRKTHNLLIGERTAEEVKIDVGSAVPPDFDLATTVKGRELSLGLPRTVRVTGEEICGALQDILINIAELVKATLELTPPELASDIIQEGIVLTGGGSLLRDLDKYLTKSTGIKCCLARDPISCVVYGTDKLFCDEKLMKTIFGGR